MICQCIDKAVVMDCETSHVSLAQPIRLKIAVDGQRDQWLLCDVGYRKGSALSINNDHSHCIAADLLVWHASAVHCFSTYQGRSHFYIFIIPLDHPSYYG